MSKRTREEIRAAEEAAKAKQKEAHKIADELQAVLNSFVAQRVGSVAGVPGLTCAVLPSRKIKLSWGDEK